VGKNPNTIRREEKKRERTRKENRGEEEKK